MFNKGIKIIVMNDIKTQGREVQHGRCPASNALYVLLSKLFGIECCHQC